MTDIEEMQAHINDLQSKLEDATQAIRLAKAGMSGLKPGQEIEVFYGAGWHPAKYDTMVADGRFVASFHAPLTHSFAGDNVRFPKVPS